MRPTPELPDLRLDPPRRSLASIAGRILLHLIYLVIALGAFLRKLFKRKAPEETETRLNLEE